MEIFRQILKPLETNCDDAYRVGFKRAGFGAKLQGLQLQCASGHLCKIRQVI